MSGIRNRRHGRLLLFSFRHGSLWVTAQLFIWRSVGIDAELYESAVLDGAGKFKQAVYITIPGIKITIITLLIMSVGNLFNADFGLFYYTTKDVGTLYPTTQVLSTYTYRVLRVLGDVGMSSAAGFYQSIVGFVLVLIANSAVKKIDSESSIF